MLRQWNSRTPSFGVFVERECPRCHRPVELPLGEICESCRGDIRRRAQRLGRRIAGVTTIAMALYVWLRMPDDGTARAVGALGVVAWYVLTYLVVRRVAQEYLS